MRAVLRVLDGRKLKGERQYQVALETRYVLHWVHELRTKDMSAERRQSPALLSTWAAFQMLQVRTEYSNCPH